jgi:hypothetical protein
MGSSTRASQVLHNGRLGASVLLSAKRTRGRTSRVESSEESEEESSTDLFVVVLLGALVPRSLRVHALKTFK